MFSPIKKIFTYIQKNASGSNMFSPSGNTTAGQREEAPSLSAHDEGDRKEQDQVLSRRTIRAIRNSSSSRCISCPN